jgi:predicted phosphodiesterase
VAQREHVEHVPPSGPELTTVGTHEAVIHDGTSVRRYDGLAPDTEYEIEGFTFRTLPEPGELLATFATVNDVHFGEVEAGLIEGSDVGPTFRSAPGEEPYPELMNRCAVAEIAALDPPAVIVKGDLTSTGTVEEYDRFREVYEPAFGERLTYVRGNHESYYDTDLGAIPHQEVVLPGVRIALLDTSRQRAPGGGVDRDQLDWLDDMASASDRPVIVMGHHHLWDPSHTERPADYFGIRPDDSIALVDLVAGRPSIIGYFAGHTHRNRVRRFAVTGDVPWVEVASVKEYPGTWAEYRVYDGGVLQIHRRISDPEALAWTEKTKGMYAGLYHDYAFGQLPDRCFAFGLR